MPVAVLAIAVGLAVTAVAWAAPKLNFHEAHAHDFDPEHNNMVQSGWVAGLGCPTTFSYFAVDGTRKTYNNPVCSDTMDKKNDGLLMTKSSPSNDIAAAVVELKEVKNTTNTFTEIGFDLRKPAPEKTDNRGSQCGNTAPAFVFVFTSGPPVVLPCTSATSPVSSADTSNVNDGWLRMRWTGSALDAMQGRTLSAAYLKFDSGPTGEVPPSDPNGGDANPSNFGVAVLDNIDINGQFVGNGPPPNGD